MIRLVYVSTCAQNVQLEDVEAVLRASESWNADRGISGMLCWSGEFFLQCLEGERGPVTQCFAHIAKDRRHHSVELIVSSPTNRRWFAMWGMGFTRLMSSNRVDLPNFAGGNFNPYLLEATDLQDTFERLAVQAKRLSLNSEGAEG